jgi:hypothetical protein
MVPPTFHIGYECKNRAGIGAPAPCRARNGTSTVSLRLQVSGSGVHNPEDNTGSSRLTAIMCGRYYRTSDKQAIAECLESMESHLRMR